MFTEEYVNTRIAEIAENIKQVYVAFKHDDLSVVDIFINRMNGNDFVLNKPITPAYRLKMAKRLARYYIKQGITYSPAQKALKSVVLKQYQDACRKRLDDIGYCDLFSFETWSCKKLKIDYSQYKSFFKITP